MRKMEKDEDYLFTQIVSILIRYSWNFSQESFKARIKGCVRATEWKNGAQHTDIWSRVPISPHHIS